MKRYFLIICLIGTCSIAFAQVYNVNALKYKGTSNNITAIWKYLNTESTGQSIISSVLIKNKTSKDITITKDDDLTITFTNHIYNCKVSSDATIKKEEILSVLMSTEDQNISSEQLNLFNFKIQVLKTGHDQLYNEKMTAQDRIKSAKELTDVCKVVLFIKSLNIKIQMLPIFENTDD